MTSGIVAALASAGAGVILAVVAVFGGVQAITPSANPSSASDDVVLYDAR